MEAVSALCQLSICKQQHANGELWYLFDITSLLSEYCHVVLMACHIAPEACHFLLLTIGAQAYDKVAEEMETERGKTCT